MKLLIGNADNFADSGYVLTTSERMHQLTCCCTFQRLVRHRSAISSPHPRSCSDARQQSSASSPRPRSHRFHSQTRSCTPNAMLARVGGSRNMHGCLCSIEGFRPTLSSAREALWADQHTPCRIHRHRCQIPTAGPRQCANYGTRRPAASCHALQMVFFDAREATVAE